MRDYFLPPIACGKTMGTQFLVYQIDQSWPKKPNPSLPNSTHQKMSCRTTLNALTTNIASTSIPAVTPSSLLLSNITPNSFLALGRRIGGSSITNLNHFHLLSRVCNHGVGSNKKLRCSFVTYAGFLELPLLPFPSDQVLVPSETKTLHLFEARYLKLLDEVDPFLEGTVLPLQDNVPQNASEISSKAAKDEPLQTQTANSLEWALQEPILDCEEAFIPSFAERSTQSEMMKLKNEKLKAMDVKETLERLENSLSFINNIVSMTAAKLAIQSLNMQ
ncbi:hypothetical protein Ccrd_023550 [Cynara cardunculus var. scolymus]|uniref:Uncharacterized protein n=1 Tax=Cynara cardunculus var. scolymus TaxID=59895 RepID=A0A103XWS4_CYNCS|nr:hypothetical protein Ccrd_023550 [Cynara cardunculus var. scolymus]